MQNWRSSRLPSPLSLACVVFFFLRSPHVRRTHPTLLPLLRFSPKIRAKSFPRFHAAAAAAAARDSTSPAVLPGRRFPGSRRHRRLRPSSRRRRAREYPNILART
uniref:Uncharacterized protein n=1 Tax=Oryza nivara TaxID=4536 RepID=A0A0E0G8E0_ORYNI